MSKKLQNLMEGLGARPYEFATKYPANFYEIEDIQTKLRLSLPEKLIWIMKKYRAAISFESGAVFKPEHFSGREGKNGYMSIGLLYGIRRENSTGIIEVNASLERHDFFPSGIIAIGDSIGGDQICISLDTQEIYYWKHDVGSDRRESLSVIANSFDDFLERLEVEKSELQHKSLAELGVIKDKSYLDF